MKRFCTAAVKGGHVVAYLRQDGTLCAISDHGTRASAKAEAQRLTAAELIRHQRETLRAIVADVAIRRHVRYFEPDAFA